jgi:hypothetical protein
MRASHASPMRRRPTRVDSDSPRCRVKEFGLGTHEVAVLGKGCSAATCMSLKSSCSSNDPLVSSSSCSKRLSIFHAAHTHIASHPAGRIGRFCCVDPGECEVSLPPSLPPSLTLCLFPLPCPLPLSLSSPSLSLPSPSPLSAGRRFWLQRLSEMPLRS